MVTGNRNILNSIKGITSVVKLTAEEKTALADRVLPANVLVVDSSNIVYLTDGVTAVKALNPLLASSNNYAYDKDVVHLTGDETINGTKTFSAAIVGSVTGNAGSATKLATARTINGTSFNGTANITTANWGTARDITIADSTGDNTGEAVSVNGSAAVTLKLPATIKASLDGNAATATSATTAASATTATNATNAAKLNNIASSGYVQTGKVNQTINGTKTFSAAIASSIKTNTYIDGNKGVAIINSTAPAGYNMLYRIKSTNGVFTGGVFNQNYELHYTVDTTVAANTNAVTYTTTLMNEAGDATFAKNVTIGVGLTVKGDANFANITTNYITGLFTE